MVKVLIIQKVRRAYFKFEFLKVISKHITKHIFIKSLTILRKKADHIKTNQKYQVRNEKCNYNLINLYIHKKGNNVSW